MLATAAADAHINQPWPDKVHACVVVQLSTMLVCIVKGRGWGMPGWGGVGGSASSRCTKEPTTESVAEDSLSSYLL